MKNKKIEFEIDNSRKISAIRVIKNIDKRDFYHFW